MPQQRDDRRIRRTRKALLEAFGGLVLERQYDGIRVGDILERADVGRSTFYEHFRNKDDMLLQSMSDLLCVLADAITEHPDLKQVEMVLTHFRRNRRRALDLLGGSLGPRIARRLTDLVEPRLPAGTAGDRADPLPPRLLAARIASAQLGLIAAWLQDEAPCAPAVLAAALAAAER